MRLWFGNPVPLSERNESLRNLLIQNVENMVRDGTSVSVHGPESGYPSASHAWTRLYNSVEGVKCYYKAWKKGYDGIIIGCITDPGLTETRSVIDIPVAGVCESAVLISSCLGSKFSIITHDRATGAILADKIKCYGLSEKLASIRCVGFSAAEAVAASSNPTELINTFNKQAEKAIEEDEAEVIIPGCTIISSILTSQKIRNIKDVPVIDPVWAGIKMAEIFVDLKKSYNLGVCRKSIYSVPRGWEREITITT